MISVFLSHTNAEKPFVERIDEALADNDVFWVVMSPSAIRSNWVRRELNSSLMRRFSSRRIRVLLVLLEACDILSIISYTKYTDFTQDYAKGFAELCDALDLGHSVLGYALNPQSVLSQKVQMVIMEGNHDR